MVVSGTGTESPNATISLTVSESFGRAWRHVPLLDGFAAKIDSNDGGGRTWGSKTIVFVILDESVQILLTPAGIPGLALWRGGHTGIEEAGSGFGSVDPDGSGG